MKNKPFYVEFPITVRSYDIDVNDHVSNIVYIRWLEDMRMTMLDTYMPYEAIRKKGLSLILIRTEIDYKRGIGLFEKPLLQGWIEGLEGIRMYIRARFLVEGRVAASARQTGVFLDLNRQRPARLPSIFIQKIKEWE